MGGGLERYYLGADPGWLWKPPPGLPANAGLFVSHRRLAKDGRDYSRSRYRRATVSGWALDSGGFSEIDKHGRYSYLASEYVWAMRRYDAEIGRLEWAAPMDWMCEPQQVERTGLSVREHQERTVANFLELCNEWWLLDDVRTGIELRIPGYRSQRDPSLCPIMPVIQGWTLADYLRCVDLYEQAGVHLSDYQIVGVGSVCRRSNTTEGVRLLRALHRELEQRYPGHVDRSGGIYPSGLSLHAFGVTTAVLKRIPGVVETADSRAWCMAGMKRGGRCRHPASGVAWEQNCPSYAVEWLGRVQDGTEPDDGPEPEQQLLFDVAELEVAA